MKKNTLILFLLSLNFMASAQLSIERQVVSTGGAEMEQGAVMLCWTLGEIVTETFVDGSVTMSNGFQQGKFTITGIAEKLEAAISVYPNPTWDFVHIEVSTNEDLEATLYDALGKKLSTTLLPIQTGGIYSISLESLASGNYFLTITNDRSQSQSFKIQKFNQ